MGRGVKGRLSLSKPIASRLSAESAGAGSSYREECRERVGLDCDGVLADFAGYVLRQVNAELGKSYRVAQWRAWRIDECFGAEVGAFCDRLIATRETWLAMRPYRGVVEHVRALAGRYDIYIITSIPPRFAVERIQWLQRWGFPFTEFVPVERSDAKVDLARQYGLCAFVEDLERTANQMAELGLASYLVPRPWNREGHHAGVRRWPWPQIVADLLSRPAGVRPGTGLVLAG